MNRLEEIEVRMKEIGELLTDEKRDALKEEDVVKLEKEVAELKEKRSMIEEYMNDNQERRSRLDKLKEEVLASAAAGVQKPTPKGRVEFRKYTEADEVYRDAWANTLLCNPLTEAQRNALIDVNPSARLLDCGIDMRQIEMRQQEAITTTATEYVQPSGSVVGINNGGLFIPKYVSDMLLDQIALGSPILEDVRKMSVAGMISYPYKKYADPAKWVEEGVCNDLESIEWDELKSTMHELSKTVRTTWRLEALTPDSFINYLIQELRIEMQEERVRGLVYGTGGLEPTGIKMSSPLAPYVTGDKFFNSIAAAGMMIPARFIAGAKLYVSRSLESEISLTRDGDGKFVLPPINNNSLDRVVRFPVEMDPHLNDGDAILANLRQGVILNTVEPVSITKDVSGRCKINDYTAWELLSIFVLPGYTIFLQEDSTPTP